MPKALGISALYNLIGVLFRSRIPFNECLAWHYHRSYTVFTCSNLSQTSVLIQAWWAFCLCYIRKVQTPCHRLPKSYGKHSYFKKEMVAHFSPIGVSVGQSYRARFV